MDTSEPWTNSFLMDEMQFRISFWRLRSSSLAMRQSLCGAGKHSILFRQIEHKTADFLVKMNFECEFCEK